MLILKIWRNKYRGRSHACDQTPHLRLFGNCIHQYFEATSPSSLPPHFIKRYSQRGRFSVFSVVIVLSIYIGYMCNLWHNSLRVQMHNAIWKWQWKTLPQQRKNCQAYQALLRVKQQLLHKVNQPFTHHSEGKPKEKKSVCVFSHPHEKYIILCVKYQTWRLCKCSLLPAYQILMYISIHRKYTCKHCVKRSKDLEPHCVDHTCIALHEKWSFSLRISSVNMWPNQRFTANWVTFTE